MARKRLIKRLEWYYPTERFHAYFSFPLLAIYNVFSNQIKDILFLLYGLLVCIFILYQGQLYWRLKLSSLMGGDIKQGEYINFFRKSKIINIILIGLTPLFFIFQLVLQKWDHKINGMLYWGVLANAFAILEYVNYYHVQLMYDNKFDLGYLARNRKLKRASLAKDLAANRT